MGGVDVPFDKRLAGHSDGDIVCHALIDALCGAAGLPDIGEQFPDTDPQWRGADSTRLVEKVVERVRDLGYAAVNADVVIHAERPKLSPFKAAIAGRLADLLGLEPDCVSVKAKTNEGVDAVGRGEAMACTAIVGLTRV